jgi:hypothetical protein
MWLAILGGCCTNTVLLTSLFAVTVLPENILLERKAGMELRSSQAYLLSCCSMIQILPKASLSPLHAFFTPLKRFGPVLEIQAAPIKLNWLTNRADDEHD